MYYCSMAPAALRVYLKGEVTYMSDATGNFGSHLPMQLHT